MTDKKEQIHFYLNGMDATANMDETIWQVATRMGIEIPHLCYSDEPGYRADGNCRACMVEVEGERVLAASCIRTPTPGMKVNTASKRADDARKMVFELLLADQPEATKAHEKESKFSKWAEKQEICTSRFPRKTMDEAITKCDDSHLAMRVNLDACIHCNLCVRACREVQVNDVIGLSSRGKTSKITFDFDDNMGDSTCVACGECVQACPTGALMPSSMLNDQQIDKRLDEGEADKIIHSLCPFCGVGCQTEIHVKDNKILKVDGANGPANQQRLCVKGRFGMDYAMHEDRLTQPLIRRDDAPKHWDCDIDPANPYTHFRAASWDEALTRASEGFLKIRNKNGPKALCGFGSAKGSNEEAYLFQKLIRTGFGTNNVDHCTRLCHASSVAALLEGVGSGAVSAPFMAAEDADCIIVIGARPTENHPVAATFFKQAAKNGKKLILMDPRKHGLTRHAHKHLQFKPGTDVALLNAIIHVIIAENLTNDAYIEKNVDDFAALKSRVKSFSPEAMQDACGIDADDIREVARLYATSEKSIIFWGMGVSQHVHGTDNARCLIALSAITGHVGRAGTGLHPLRGQNNVQGASDVGLIPMMYPDYQHVANDDNRTKFEKLWNISLDPTPGLTVVEIINAAIAGQIKGMYIMGENPAMSDPDAKHAREALAALDHLVVQEIFLTETAFHADVILPASAFPEKLGSFTNTNRQVQLARPALNMPGDARQDWHIIQDIAQRMGLNWQYNDPSDIYAEMQQGMESIAGISWQRLMRDNSVTYPCAGDDVDGQDIIFTNGFPTKNGKVKLVPTDLLPPDELPDDDFPFVLTTGRLLEHWHTGAMTRRSNVLDNLEPEAVAHLHPREMDKQNLTPGDKIHVETRRGAITVTVRSDRDVADGMVFVPFCFAEGAANMLTNPVLDPFGKIPEFKFCAARIEKAG